MSKYEELIVPDLRIIVAGSGGEETIFKAIVAGAKTYVNEAASLAEFVQANFQGLSRLFRLSFHPKLW